jgi:hypothetical protein
VCESHEFGAARAGCSEMLRRLTILLVGGAAAVVFDDCSAFANFISNCQAQMPGGKCQVDVTDMPVLGLNEVCTWIGTGGFNPSNGDSCASVATEDIFQLVIPHVSSSEYGCQPILCGANQEIDTACMTGSGPCDGVELTLGEGFCSELCNAWTGDAFVGDDGIDLRVAFCSEDSAYMKFMPPPSPPPSPPLPPPSPEQPPSSCVPCSRKRHRKRHLLFAALFSPNCCP